MQKKHKALMIGVGGVYMRYATRKSLLFRNRNTASRSALTVKRSEHTEAVALAGYLRYLERLGKIEVYSHIPHETYTTSWNARRKNVQEGVRRGVPDYIIITPCHILFIELKALKGVISAEQKIWIEKLNNKIALSFVAKGFDAAKIIVDQHL